METKLLLLLLACLTSLETDVESAKILAVFPTISRSHHIWNHALVVALSTRGHHVDVLSPFTESDTPTLRYFLLEDSYNNFHSGAQLIERATFTPKQNIDAFLTCCNDLCKNQINSNGSREILKLKDKYDLLIMESFAFECFFGFIPHFNIPTIGVSAHGYTPWNNLQMGVPEMSAVYPLEAFPFTVMTFWQRVYNVLLTQYMLLTRRFIHLPKHEANARDVFGHDMPSLLDIEQTFSLFLVNAGPGLDTPRPRPPSVIEVGCLHCRPGEPLPQDIQSFLDGASEGAVFFSLGSNVRSDKMPAEKLQAFMSAFSKLKQRVLWKWESDAMPGQPENVKLSKWLPQQDVLAHHNVRLFMTHGGRLSSLEGVYHGVPMLVIPVYYDQYMHSHRVENLGLGLRLDFNNVTEEALSSALKRLLADDKYLAKARHTSQVSRDQPESAMDRAVFWTEYVIRHKGAPHLRSAALDLAWYQLYLLDVMALLAAVPLVLVLVTTCLVRCAVRPRDSFAVTDRKKKRR